MASRHRSASDLSSMQADANRNVNWARTPSFWLSYIIGLVLVRVALLVFFPAWKDAEMWEWTILVVSHTIISFLALHWVRGTPIWEDQGQYINMTVWEQMDNGVPWTKSKKFLMIVPIALFLIASHATDYATVPFVINAICTIILVAGKLPEMHGVRLFHINEGAKDDEKDQ